MGESSSDERVPDLRTARLQWQLGRMRPIAELRHADLESRPDRAALALLASGACQQLGLQRAAAELARQAMNWGCSRKEAADLLVAGLELTMASAYMILGNGERSKRHYRLADEINRRMVQDAIADHGHRGQQRIGLSASEADTGVAANPNGSTGDCLSIPDEGITSYAQNFEDVMLWRALGRITNGVYIDVGAQDPIVDSISRGFYEKGWRGIHIEPVAEYCEMLRADRPDEIVIEALVSESESDAVLYKIPGTGISTGVKEIAERHLRHGFDAAPIDVRSITLAEVFSRVSDREIHWLKIDTEGMEEQVLLSWHDAPARPWIVVVESTLPLTQVENYANWEPHLTSRGYRPIYFDGLNRFYLARAHMNLERMFKVPPNVFDRFVLKR